MSVSNIDEVKELLKKQYWMLVPATYTDEQIIKYFENKHHYKPEHILTIKTLVHNWKYAGPIKDKKEEK